MKSAGKSSHYSRNYTPQHAAEELQKEMHRYSKDKESCAVSALDFCYYLLQRLEMPDTANSVRLAKLAYTEMKEKEDPYEIRTDIRSLTKLTQEEALKAALIATSAVFYRMGWNGVGLVLENHVTEKFGELDEHSQEFKTALLKKAREKQKGVINKPVGVKRKSDEDNSSQ